MSSQDSPKKRERKKKVNDKVTPGQSSEHPSREDALPISGIDKNSAKKVDDLIELSFLSYIKELKKKEEKDDDKSMVHLHNILSEYLGPYMLIGYLPTNEPVEVVYAPSTKDKEAIIERLRKTFCNYFNPS